MTPIPGRDRLTQEPEGHAVRWSVMHDAILPIVTANQPIPRPPTRPGSPPPLPPSPPDPSTPPVEEPDPDLLPDEVPNPNPDETNPPLVA